MATTFFALSLEIRDEIYSYLWAKIDRIDVREDANIAVRALLPWDGAHRGYPCWIFSSRQILGEAIAVLHRVSVFVLEIRKPAWHATEIFDPSILWPCSAAEIRTLQIQHLYRVDEAWTNQPPVLSRDSQNQTSYMNGPEGILPNPVSSSSDDAPKIKVTSLNFLSKMLITMPTLRSLKITISPYPERNYATLQILNIRSDQNQDIPRLCAATAPILHQLRRFEIYVSTQWCEFPRVVRPLRVLTPCERKGLRDAACSAIEAWVDEQIEKVEERDIGGFVMGKMERRMLPSGDSERIVGWRVVWVRAEGRNGEGV